MGKNGNDESVKRTCGQKCNDEDTGLKKKEKIHIKNTKGSRAKTEKSKKKGKNEKYI